MYYEKGFDWTPFLRRGKKKVTMFYINKVMVFLA